MSAGRDPILLGLTTTTTALALFALVAMFAPASWMVGTGDQGANAVATTTGGLPVARPLSQFTAAIERPLFVATRRATPAARPAANLILGKYRLTGVIVSPNLRQVMLTSVEGRALSVAEGARIEGWVVRDITNRQFVLEQDGKRETIRVPERGGASP